MTGERVPRIGGDGWALEHGVGWVRTDPDGTAWTINHDVVRGGATLTMRYREHGLKSHHKNVDAAKRHRDDTVRMLAARSLRDYSGRAR